MLYFQNAMTTNSIITFLLFVYIDQVNSFKTEKYPGFLTYYEPFKITNIAAPTAIDQHYALRIEFFAFHIHFNLIINQGSQVITPFTHISSHTIKTTLLNKQKILNHLIEGKVTDDPNSFVHGTFNNGILNGVIHMSNQTYYIENSENFFQEPSNISTSIIFRNSDLNLTRWTKNQSQQTPFKYLHGPFKNLSIIHRRDTKETDRVPIDHVPPRLPEDIFLEDPSAKMPMPKDYNPVCLITVVVDHTFYQTVGKRNFRKTAEEVIYLVSEANRIFELTDFNSDGHDKDVSLQIKSMIIHKSSSDPNYNLFNERLSAEQMLQKVSEYDFDDDCLGVAFSFRSFPKRVLGLAFIADAQPDGTLGGICQERRYLGLRRRSMSYNAAFITVAKGGIQLPRLMSVITLTHELGHSFGSYHDPKKIKACSPSRKEGGPYIMADSAVSGHQQNNYKFSPCSLAAMSKVLQSKAKCFATKKPICGNGIAEAFEECDCGHPIHCFDTDKCCTPAGGIGKDAECTYRRQEGSKCSHKRDACCTPECKVISASAHHQCTSLDACKQESYCDGFTGQCPVTPPKPDGYPCFDRTGICRKGECIKPCKVVIGLFDCECKQREYACTACCYSSNSSECLPAIKFGIIATNGLPLLKPKGELCDNGRGICNVLGDCVEEYKQQREVYDEYEPESEGSDFDTLTTLLIILLVLLCIGLMLCLIVCVTPFAKFMQQPVSNPDYTTAVIYQKPKKGGAKDQCVNAVTTVHPNQTVCCYAHPRRVCNVKENGNCNMVMQDCKMPTPENRNGSVPMQEYSPKPTPPPTPQNS